jgi:hypothetical protein
MKMDYLYALKDPRTNRVRYIGLSCNPVQRLGNHLSELNRGRPKDLWIADLKRNGLKPALEVIQEFPSAENNKSIAAELETIAFFMRHLPAGLLLNRAGTSPPRIDDDFERGVLRRRLQRAKWSLAFVEADPNLCDLLDAAVGKRLRHVNRKNREEWSRYLCPAATNEYDPMLGSLR